MTDSLQQLAKSQLFDTNGRTLIFAEDSSDMVENRATILRLENTIVDQKFKVLRLVGEGGMGAVYRVHHLTLDKDVALKTFLSTNLSQETWKRFQREAQAIARLTHINIVQVFDFGVRENNIPYYTMEFLSGQSLAERIAESGPLPAAQAIGLFIQVLNGLAEAHKKGIIHRDLKPANIFLTNDLTPDKDPLTKIVDFGIAGLAERSVDGQKITTTGSIFGSPLYMSPEQSMGRQLTEQSDIYSCGCALFEALTGTPPFRGENAFTTMLAHQQSAIPSLDERAPGTSFPRGLNYIVSQMLAKDPGDRLQTATQVVTALKKLEQKN